jgi:hypothetical protein
LIRPGCLGPGIEAIALEQFALHIGLKHCTLEHCTRRAMEHCRESSDACFIRLVHINCPRFLLPLMRVRIPPHPPPPPPSRTCATEEVLKELFAETAPPKRPAAEGAVMLAGGALLPVGSSSDDDDDENAGGRGAGGALLGLGYGSDDEDEGLEVKKEGREEARGGAFASPAPVRGAETAALPQASEARQQQQDDAAPARVDSKAVEGGAAPPLAFTSTQVRGGELWHAAE